MNKTVALALMFAVGFTQAAFADEEDHPELFGAVQAFHDVLRVDWHAEPGETRNDSACRNIGSYVTLARDIAHQAAPDHAQPEEWQITGAALADASVALGAYCASGAAANVEAGLTTIHDRFHDLMSLLREPADD